MERRDLYDENRNLTGETIYKDEPIPKGRFILLVAIFIQNSEGKFLIQKRSEIKNGKYATTGGHAKTGETSLEAVLAETREEIGIELDPSKLQLFYSGKKNNVFWDNYYIKMDIPNIEELVLQEEEVESVCWMSFDEIRESMRNDTFFVNHFEEFERLEKWLENKNRNDK